MSVTRRYFKYDIEQLEKDAQKNADNSEILSELYIELGYRNSQRAQKLRKQISLRLEVIKKSNLKMADSSPDDNVELTTTVSKEVLYVSPKKSNPDKPEHILSAWTALEVLSPQSFKKPQDLASGGDRRLIASFEHKLPWEDGGEKAKPNFRLFYQVILGTISMDKAISKLLEVYSDSREERPQVKGETILGAIVVDRYGRPVDDDAVAISSFAWGLQHALNGNLDKLSQWVKAEKELLAGFNKFLSSKDQNEQELPLTTGILRSAYQHLVTKLNLPTDLVIPNQFAVRVYEWYKNPEPPEPLLLNSFFLNDLSKASDLFACNRETPNLKKYLGLEVSKTRKDMLRDFNELERVVSPELIPPSRWPSRGNAALVLLQQAAVNATLAYLKSSGISAVNGPPGTGKTTLLRDLVAGIVCERAEALCKFDDPETAFSHSGQKLPAGQAWLKLYGLDPSIKGHEIVIMSSNNKAVENVSAELPGINAIGDFPELRYFNALSNELLGRETWGLIAAVLGNMSNRSKFRKIFWWDADFGMSTYLAEAAGTPQFIDVKDPKTQKTIGTRKPSIIASEAPPDNHVEALKQWKEMRKEFITALDSCRLELKKRVDARQLIKQLPFLLQQLNQARKKHSDTLADNKRIKSLIENLRQTVESLTLAAEKIITERKAHKLLKPNWLKLLFNIAPSKSWKVADKLLRDKLNQLVQEISDGRSTIAEKEGELEKSDLLLKEHERQAKLSANEYADASKRIEAIRASVGANLMDETFTSLAHNDRQQISPWHDPSMGNYRDRVFIAAIKLHKAFINAAAKPLRHNIGALMMLFNGKELLDKSKQAIVPDLWSSLFLIVPAISTTFASVERMLGQLPPESLGWLLVDEAGQALPQAAVGALMRTRRAVIVGDPIQIEPVVSLPDSLTKAINRHYVIDPDRFNAPQASAQTMADAASGYYTEIESKQGSRHIGMPLLVHRRCADPMFRIANGVAYNNLMVQAKKANNSKIRDCLGQATWYDVSGTGIEKWSPEEGAVLLQLLQRMKTNKVHFDLYIVTPFVVVADNLRRMVLQSGILQDLVPDPSQWVYERIGTVHTVQGREAEAVFFVLGAPLAQQRGARNWAGSRPNLLNVAVTRAKESLYVIGNRDLWKDAGVFKNLADSLAVVGK